MNRLRLTNTLTIALAFFINLSHELSVKDESELTNFYSSVLLKLDHIEKSNAENAASLRKELSEQSSAIQQLKSKQESTHVGAISLSEDDKGSLQQISKQISNLVDAVQQLQQKQSKTEKELRKNLHSIRLLIDSSSLKLGDMLISAVKNGDLEHVIFLLGLGAPIDYQNSEKNRPIHVAVQQQQHRILEALLENKADIHSKGIYDQTALNLAGYSNCVECARILLDKGANIGSRDQWGNTPIIHPARAGHKEFVELLLQRGADVNDAQVEGVTGLHWAARDGNLPVVKFLIEKGANARLKTRNGQTPVDEAVANNHPDVADFLRDVLKKN